jgi:hypothetical protein
MVDINLKEYIDESITFTKRLVNENGHDKSSKLISNVLHNLSADGDAIYCTGQILFYSLCLKYLKENLN